MLQKVPVKIDFTNGVNRAEDEFLAIGTKFQTLKNGEFDGRDSVQTRAGWERLISGTAYSGDNPGMMRRLMALGAEILLESTTGLHTADVTGNRWRQVASTLNRCAADLDGVFHGHGHVFESDVAGTDSLKVIAYATNRSSAVSASHVWLQVVQNGVVIRDQRIDTNVNGDARSPRVVYASSEGRFYVYWTQNTAAANQELAGTSFLATSLGAAISVTVIANNLDGTCPIDAVWHPDASGGGAVFAAYKVAAGASQDIRCLKVSRTDGVTILSSATAVSIAAGSVNYLVTVPTFVGGATGYIVLAHTTTAAEGLFLLAGDLDNGVPAVTYAVDNTLNLTGRMAAIRDPNFTGNFWLVWEAGAAGAGVGSGTTLIQALNYRCTTFAPTFAAVGGFAATTVGRGVGLASGLHVRGRAVYVGAVHYSEIQPTHFELEIGRTTGSGASATTSQHDVCCRLGFNEAFLFNSTYGGALPNLWRASGSNSTTQMLAAIPRTVMGASTTFTLKQRGNGDRVVSGGSASQTYDVTLLGLDLLSLHWSSGLNEVEIAETLVMAGACPLQWDGVEVSELGYNLYPEIVNIGVFGVGTGSLAGTYSVVAAYEWVDQKGNKHWSRPSVAKQVVLTPGDGFTIDVTTARLTRKTGLRIVVFVTEANGSLHYRARTYNSGTGVVYGYGVPNDPTVDTVRVDSNGSLAAASIIRGELLYTTGGVLPSGAYPACKHVASVQDRLWFAGAEENQIRYTEARTIGFFPATHEVYTFETDTSLGRVSALEGLDDKVVVLQEKQISVIVGRGPNRLGQQNDFSPIQKIIGGAGHSWERSNVVALDSDGLWFMDNSRGLRHINRALQLSEIQISDGNVVPLGAEVDELIESGVLSACVLQNKKQVRFSNASRVVVWDYENKQWSVSDSALVLSFGAGVTSDGEYRFIAIDIDNSTNYVWRELASRTSDYGSSATETRIVLQLLTSWLKVGSLSGFQRVYEVQMVGKFLNGVTGNTMNGSDQLLMEQAADYKASFASAVLFPSAVGNWTAFGNESSFHLSSRPVSQKCAAMQLQFSVSSLAKFRISGISLQIGIKRGMFKTAGAKRF